MAFSESADCLERLDIVILDAGVYRVNMEFNPSTGHGEDLQTNHLSTILLVLLFARTFRAQAKRLSGATPGRIVIVSSDIAGWAKFPQRDAEPLLPALDHTTQDMVERYGVSKFLGQLFVSELVKIVPSSTVIINMVKAGFCYGSGLARDVSGTLFGAIFFIFSHIVGHSPAVGARALIDAAVRKGQESRGHYVEGGKLRP